MVLVVVVVVVVVVLVVVLIAVVVVSVVVVFGSCHCIGSTICSLLTCLSGGRLVEPMLPVMRV